MASTAIKMKVISSDQWQIVFNALVDAIVFSKLDSKLFTETAGLYFRSDDGQYLAKFVKEVRQYFEDNNLTVSHALLMFKKS